VDTGACAEADDQARVALAVYEQRAVVPDDAVRRAMEPALGRVRARQAVPLDVELGTPIGREGDLESPLGNLFAQAMAEATGADVAINNNKIGGLRADLDAGPLTFGRLYNVFPFDDRLLRLSVTGAQLRAIFAADVRRARRGSLGVSGISVRASCSPEGLHIALTRPSGASVTDEERLTLATTDLLARGPLFASLADEDRLTVPDSAPMAREVVAGWLTARGGRLSAGEFLDPARPRWDPFDARVSRCEATSTR
jgi:5'-nucleotidase